MDSTNLPTREGEIHADHPKPGWYRMREYRDGPWKPVCIWHFLDMDGKLVARVGDKMKDPAEIWTFCGDKPVTAEAAKFAFKHGRWETEPEPIKALSNLPADPYDALVIEVQEHIARSDQWMREHEVLANQGEADFARHLQVEIQNLKKRADDMHKAEKAPNIKEGKAIDNRYRFRENLDVGNNVLRGLVTRFLQEERARTQAELLARAKVDEPPPEPVRPQAGGMVGKRAGLATVWRAEVVDYQLAAAHFIGHPDLRAVVQRLANHAVRDAKGSIEIPGVTNIKDEVAR